MLPYINNETFYTITARLGISYNKLTNEIVLADLDDGSEFLLQDMEEAEKAANLILEIVREANE